MRSEITTPSSDDWYETTWGELVELKYGKGLREYKDAIGKFPVYGTNGAVGWCDKPLCEFPSIIIGRKGAYRGVHYSDLPFYVIDTAYFTVPKKDINLKWAYYNLLTQDITGLDSGSAIPSTRREDFYHLPVKVPPLKVQDEIVSNLDSLNNKIAINRQINQTLESMAQAIFKSWFVDFDPVKAKLAAIEAGEDTEGITRAAMRAISGKTDDELDQMQAGQPENYAKLKTTAGLFPAAMQDSEFGEVPEGWGLKPLYETAEYVNGAAFKAKYFSDNRSGLPIIKIAELKQGISSGTKYTNENVKKKYFIDNDDVLYSWSGSPETSLEVFKWFGGKGYLNQHIFKLNFENSQQKYFAYFLLQHMKPLLIRTAQQKQTTGLGHVTVADMKRMLVVYPDNQTLTRFSDVVGSIYEQNSILQRENSKLVALRDTLLPKLLSGKLSVDVIEMARGE